MPYHDRPDVLRYYHKVVMRICNAGARGYPLPGMPGQSRTFNGVYINLLDDAMQEARVALWQFEQKYDATRMRDPKRDFVRAAAAMVVGRVRDFLRAQTHSRSKHTPHLIQIGLGIGINAGVEPAGKKNAIANSLRSAQTMMPDQDQWVATVELRRALARYRRMKLLTPREHEVLKLYYWECRTFKQIGKSMGVVESRACQLHKAALVKLRRLLNAHPHAHTQAA